MVAKFLLLLYLPGAPPPRDHGRQRTELLSLFLQLPASCAIIGLTNKKKPASLNFVIILSVLIPTPSTCRVVGAGTPRIPGGRLRQRRTALHAAVAAGKQQHGRTAATVVDTLPVQTAGQISPILYTGHQAEPAACRSVQVITTSVHLYYYLNKL